MRRIALLLLISLGLGAQEATTPTPQVTPAPVGTPETTSVPTPGQAPAPAPKRERKPQPLQDEGLLDPSWFGEDITFTKNDQVDFFWMKPGLDLSGRVIHMKAWDDPVMLKPKRDGKDNSVATRLTDAFPGMLRGSITGAMNGKAKASRNDGDITLIGRFVDANAGSKTAKFMIGLGAGSETATWDLKLLDTKTNELLLAVHHRCVSATMMSNIDDKLVKWADKFSLFLAQKALK